MTRGEYLHTVRELCSNHTNPEQRGVHLHWPSFPSLRRWPRSCGRQTWWGWGCITFRSVAHRVKVVVTPRGSAVPDFCLAAGDSHGCCDHRSGRGGEKTKQTFFKAADITVVRARPERRRKKRKTGESAIGLTCCCVPSHIVRWGCHRAAGLSKADVAALSCQTDACSHWGVEGPHSSSPTPPQPSPLYLPGGMPSEPSFG